MKIVHLPENGNNFIPYEIEGNNIDFSDGELMFNVSKKERDYDVKIDICQDYTGSLVMGSDAADRYVAQIVIPAREYTESEIDNPDYRPEAEEDGGMETSKKIIKLDPVPFSMDKCTLTLLEMEV